MTWVKVGDEGADEWDKAGLSDAAVRTHLDALCWSSRRLLDLRVPKRDLKRCLFSPESNAAVAELVAGGWWQDCGDTFWIGCVHPEWQQQRDQVEKRREQNRINQKHRRGHHDECPPDRKCNASADDNSDDNADDSSETPGRVGTGRDGQLDTDPHDEAQDRDEYTGGSVSWTPQVVNR